MSKITIEEACNLTYEWLVKNGVDACDISAEDFDEKVREYCAARGLRIN